MLLAMFLTGVIVGWLLGVITIMVAGALNDGSTGTDGGESDG